MRKAVWLMVVFLGLTCVGMWRATGIAQSTLWERYMAAGDRLQAQRRPLDAAKRYQAAIRRAERFGPSDPRLASSLTRYAALLRSTGQNAAAAPLEARARAIDAEHAAATIAAPPATPHRE
jgi:hypothetical protein